MSSDAPTMQTHTIVHLFKYLIFNAWYTPDCCLLSLHYMTWLVVSYKYTHTHTHKKTITNHRENCIQKQKENLNGQE